MYSRPAPGFGDDEGAVVGVAVGAGVGVVVVDGRSPSTCFANGRLEHVAGNETAALGRTSGPVLVAV